MRPHSFWSAVLIYGVMWAVLASIVFIAFMMIGSSRFSVTDILIIIGVNIPGGFLMGLVLAAFHNPVTRTFSYEDEDQFRPKFEAILRSLNFFPYQQTPPTLVYRSNSMRPPLPDITVNFGPNTARVTGSQHILGRIDNRMKVGKNLFN